MPRESNRRPLRRAVLACALLAVSYFVVPVEPGVEGNRLVARSIGTIVMVLVVGWLVFGEVRRHMARADESVSLIRLAIGLVAGVLVFALADYVIVLSDPDQFAGLRTRVDALYFALATLTTIGYGDVHAQGQLARVAVCAQMLFSVGVIATGASLLVRRMRERRNG